MRRTCTAHLESIAAYIQSRKLTVEKEKDESHEELERRIWREKANYNDEGIIFIPPLAIKQCIDEAAKRLAIKIPGRGKTLYTKHFEGGVLVVDGPSLGVHKDDVACSQFWCSPQGQKGRFAKSRVLRLFPTIPQWKATCEIHVLDDVIPKEVFETVLSEAGSFVGVGSFRAENGGPCGRFRVSKIKWS